MPFARYFTGPDVFISYARASSVTYAARLAAELSSRKLDCFLDQWGSMPGQQLPKELVSSLRLSSMLVLVGTEQAVGSAAVEEEVRTFVATGRPVVPIDVGGALPKAGWFSLVAGATLSPESVEAHDSGEPSDAVTKRV